MFTRRMLLAAGALAPVLSPSLGQAKDATPPAPTPPSLAELLRKPLVLDTALSPNGERIAALREQRDGDKRTAYVRLAKSGALDEKPTTVVIGDYDVEQVEWANDDRLLIWVSFTKGPNGKPTGIWWYDEFLPIPVRRILSIDADGNNGVVLFGNQQRALNSDFDLATVVDYMADDPKHILMQIWDYRSEVWALHKVDVYTGEAVLAEKGAQATDGWFTQNGVPVLRWDSNSRGTVVSVMARAPGESDWKLYRKIRRDEFKKLDNFDVVAGTAEAGVLLVRHRPEGENFTVIQKFDIRSLGFGEVVSRVDGRELTGAFCDERANLVATPYLDDRRNYRFTDPKLAGHFKGLNTYFGNECNVVLYDVNLDHTRFLLSVTGPRQPRAFYVYDLTAKNIAPLGESMPWLSQDRLPTVETLKVKTRDGAEVTAYLHVPMSAFKAPYPLVVMPHGGPEARDSVSWDSFAQTMAAKGWAVLQVNFRGSGGYGKAFADLGHKQWGLRMQEDVEDATDLVLAGGRIDNDRVAIWGASYGGYTALMQAVRRPKLYKAVVAIAADADLFETLAFSRREDGSDSPSYAYWLASIGDPKDDKALLEAASPARRAAEIQAPVFIMQGTEDKTVEPKQMKIMAKALKEAGKTCMTLELKGEGHNGWEDSTYEKVLFQSTNFLGEYLRAI